MLKVRYLHEYFCFSIQLDQLSERFTAKKKKSGEGGGVVLGAHIPAAVIRKDVANYSVLFCNTERKRDRETKKISHPLPFFLS